MSKIKLHQSIIKYCQFYRYTLAEEFRFEPKRMWRADYYIDELNCLIEFEGIGGNHYAGIGGHQTLQGYTSNCEKYNAASLKGFKLIRYTKKNANQVLNDLETLRKSLID